MNNDEMWRISTTESNGQIIRAVLQRYNPVSQLWEDVRPLQATITRKEAMDRMNPAKHRLVTSTEQFIAMLKRRGYTVQQTGANECRAVCGSEVYPFGNYLYYSVAEVAEWFDRWIAAGQHHMQHECGYPLLRETKNAGNHETLAYRAASAGPRSKNLLECPLCQQYVQDDSVKEIEDV